jgi:hypothetical protein
VKRRRAFPSSVTTSIPHPRHAFGVLIQSAEFRAADWLSEKVKLPAETRWQVQKTKTGATLAMVHLGGGTVCLDLDHAELKKLVTSLEQACTYK